MAATVIVWFRQDLRLGDQPALSAAVASGAGVLPVYVLDDEGPGTWAIGGAQRWWLHRSLAALAAALSARGSRLILRRGRAVETLVSLAAEAGAGEINALRHYEPWWVRAEQELAARCTLVLHVGNHLAPPEAVRSATGGQYRVYAPFQRALFQRMPPRPPQPAPDRIPAPTSWPASDRLGDWCLLPTRPNWAAGFDDVWTPGEAGAHERLDTFRSRAASYRETRDLPSDEGGSRLSPHLHFGEISPAAVWHAIDDLDESPDEDRGERHDDGRDGGPDKFRRELAWRDFATGLICQLPRYGDENGRDAFDHFPWRRGQQAQADLRAWQQGRTGYPLVDAGMRQLWASGWMHNRVRMVAASFLVKHLLIDWREGERWFWDTLVDADYGNNSVNWQWVAGTGVDANSFVRIMSPVLQSHRFDAGDYIRRWVPELEHLHDDVVHDPRAAGAAPSDYPPKLIEHRAARARALSALASMR